MIKVKDGYAKLIGTTYQGSATQVLLSNGGNLELSSKTKANTLVQRNASQHIYATYFNSAISDESLTDIGSVYVRNTSDTFIRRISKSQFYSIIDGKFVTLDTTQTITGNKTFTTQINSSLSTTTYLEGNKGKTIINSTASAGSYVMLFKGNSTNGYFTHGVYQSKYLLQYTAKTTVDENTNEVTKSATLLDESGNTSLPGNLSCGWINSSLRVDWKNDGVGLRWNGVHGVEFGGNTGYAHTTYMFHPSYSSNGPTEAQVVIENASASNTPTFTKTHAFYANGIGYHKRALGVGKEAPADGYNGGIYANTVLVNDWFRSEGNTGWYSEAWSGGWYMSDSTYIRTYGNKAVVALRYDADQGLSGSAWNNGNAAFSVRIHNNENQTPLLLAYRNSTVDTGENRLFALELLNSGSEIRFGMGGKHVAILNNKSELTASLFIGNLNGTASSANILNLQGEAGSSTGTSLPSNVGMQLFQYYNNGNGPTIYGNFLRIRGSNGGCGELFLGWQGDNNTNGIWYKSKRDVGSWGAWRQVVFTDMDVNHATSAQYLVTNYIGGQQFNPQTYFSGKVGLKVAMTGVGSSTIGSYWTDTLWINGYNGGDVKGMCALHFSRQNGPRFAISHQNFDSSSYGTPYEVWTTYNFNPNGSSSHPVVLASGYIDVTNGSFHGCKNSRITSITGGVMTSSYRVSINNAVMTSIVVQQRSTTSISGNSTSDASGRSDGAYWFSTYIINNTTANIRCFSQSSRDNDSWISRGLPWTNKLVTSISVTIFGYCT